MGAKQSKRSVDISGKEAAAAGEAGAGAGRVEPLADADAGALKPQLNGDAHIHDEAPQTEKEKQLDSGTPENEKDAITEKEGKEQQNEIEKAKEAAAVTNGDSDAKPESGDPPAAEDGKKPKKEKVKKKWSLRSISFSRKDKPKQEKKQKDEEAKTNGEPEKVPEEAAEATPETATNDIVEETKSDAETKEEKAPETPVTEPLTNGTSTPDSQKAESPAADEPAPAPAPLAAAPAPPADPVPAPAADPAPAPAPAPAEPEKPEPETTPEQLPVNGLSLEESAPETPEAPPQTEESKPEEPPTAVTTETAPEPEIPVKKEVCVEQMPLESPPPPLPANPPPSSVVSFAATTMAPELTDASLANTADILISAPHSIPITTLNNLDESTPQIVESVDNTEIITPEFKEAAEETATDTVTTILADQIKEIDDDSCKSDVMNGNDEPQELAAAETNGNVENQTEQPRIVHLEITDKNFDVVENAQVTNDCKNYNTTETLSELSINDISDESSLEKVEVLDALSNDISDDIATLISTIVDNTYNEVKETEKQNEDEIEDPTLPDPPVLDIPPTVVDKEDTANENICAVPAAKETIRPESIELISGDCLPPPPPMEDEVDKAEAITTEVHKEVSAIGLDAVCEDVPSETVQVVSNDEYVKDVVGTGEPPAAAPAAALDAQELLPVSDKLADLIPEVPVVPELNTDTMPETPAALPLPN